jgi:type VI secretion system protein ImpC
MSKPISFGELDFKIVASMEETRGIPEPETPFRILIMGDFSGRENREISEGGAALASCRTVEVDRDNLDEVMAGMKPDIRLQFAGSEKDAVTIRFAELDDFHPDRLYEQLEIFEAIREIRQMLEDPRTFEEAAKEIKGWTESESAEIQEPPKEAPTPAPEAGDIETAGLLDQIIEGADRQPSEAKPSSDTSEWSRFLKKIVQPHLVPGEDPRQIELEDTINAAAAALMRIILHHPNFQALEATWRAVNFLVRGLETDALLKVYLLDICLSELAADLNATEDLRTTDLYRLLVEQTVETPGAEAWALIAGNYSFDLTVADAELLGRMTRIAAAAGAPFIASAQPNLLGCKSLAQTPDPADWQKPADAEADAAWKALRKLPEAAYLGLVLPRFLLRLPYGAETDPLDNFDFEEMNGMHIHEHYLWGNSCFACAYLMGQAFSNDGWHLRPGAVQDVHGLPLHVFQAEGETRIKPCAEVLLTEHAAERILDKGLMPLLSYRDQDVIRLARFQSLAHPPSGLAGRWH